MVKRGWDKGVDFEYAYARLLRLCRRGRERERCYAFILLIQLRNGSRVSEAVRAFLEWLRTGREEAYVKLAKRKRGREEERLMVIPSDAGVERSACVELAEVREDLLVKRVKKFAENKLGFNTHSLRYAFITYLLRQGVNPAIVAKVTGHKRLDYILHYTQAKEAERLLRDL